MSLDIAAELSCSVCERDLKDPRTLPCSHYYCLGCIVQLFKECSPLPFSCPKCRKSILLPFNDPFQLPKALLAVRIRKKLGDKSEGICVKHREPKKLFCFDCDFLICATCDLTDHSDHDTQYVESEDLNERVQGIAEALAEGRSKLAQLKDALLDACHVNKRIQAEISEQEDDIKKRIKSSFEELLTFLEQRKQQLLDELCACVERKKAALDEQEKAFRDRIWEIDQTTDTLGQVEGNVQMLLEWHKLLLSNTNRVIHQSARGGFAPAAVADMSYPPHCASRVAAFITAECRVARGSPSSQSTKAEGIQSAVELMTAVPVTVSTCAENAVVTARLSPVSPGGTCDVFATNPGTFEFSYCLANRGYHRLYVEVNGLQISGSPFPVLATVAPNKLGKRVRVIGPFLRLVSMALNSDDRLVVTDAGGVPRVIVMNKQGDSVFNITSENIASPAGVTVDIDSMIYVADAASNTLLKFDGNGTFLRKVESLLESSERISTAIDIGMANNECLLVSDSESHKIRAFDRDLNLLYTVGSCGSKFGELNHPTATAYSKKSGQLFVADVGNQRVHIFTLNGTPLHYFRVFSAKGKLTSPFHICLDISEEFLFIGDTSTSSVLVFTTNGKYVSSLCLEGTPTKIAVDSDGYVYVCDSENHKITVF